VTRRAVGVAPDAGKVRALPTLFVIGKDGTIRDSFVGFTSKGTLARALARATAAN